MGCISDHVSHDNLKGMWQYVRAKFRNRYRKWKLDYILALGLYLS